MDKLRVGKTAVEGLRIFFSRIGVALKIGWVPLVVAVAIQIVSLLVILPGMVGGGSSETTFTYDPSDEATTFGAALEVFWTYISAAGWVSVALWLIGIIIYAMLGVAWLRFCLLGDDLGKRPGLLHFGGREVKVTLTYILLGLVYFVLFAAVVFVGELLGQVSGWLAAIVVILLVILLFLSMGRLSLVYPLIAVDQGVGFGTVWQLTRGNSWRLFAAYFLAGLLMLVIAMAPSVVVGLLAYAVDPIAGVSTGVMGIVNVVVQQILGIFAIMVLIGSVAEAYRQLGGPGIGVSEAELAVFDD